MGRTLNPSSLGTLHRVVLDLPVVAFYMYIPPRKRLLKKKKKRWGEGTNYYTPLEEKVTGYTARSITHNLPEVDPYKVLYYSYKQYKQYSYSIVTLRRQGSKEEQ